MLWIFRVSSLLNCFSKADGDSLSFQSASFYWLISFSNLSEHNMLVCCVIRVTLVTMSVDNKHSVQTFELFVNLWFVPCLTTSYAYCYAVGTFNINTYWTVVEQRYHKLQFLRVHFPEFCLKDFKKSYIWVRHRS